MSATMASSPTRSLTADEIRRLESSGCRADDWSLVAVSVNFDADRVRDVVFSGRVSLGSFSGTHTLPGGWEHPSGVYRASLHNVSVGHDALIRHIGRHIANYSIGDGAIIDHVDLLATEGESTFGNGVPVNVVNEAGGRDVPLVDRLSAQLAYVLAFYRDRFDVQQALLRLIARYVDGVRSRSGTVGAGAKIVNSGTMLNVRIGEAAIISGAARLACGTIQSSAAAPSRIGDGVIAENFIAASGSVIDSGARIDRCFIGQGAVIARGFSADHSLIFSNSELKHGEACSLFAGPFTTTHHKASLLIAGLFSFSNAGSGSNQSNHLYKLGPVHEGILDRGVKTGSSCYLMWPCRVGAFSVVLGRHGGKFDTSEFPFSYLFEVDGRTLLVPAANLTSVGPRRDEAKWQDRDRRADVDRLDVIHTRALTPYTVGPMIRAAALLRELDASAAVDARTVQHRGVKIPRHRIRRAIRTYELATTLFLGSVIARRLEQVAAQLGRFESGPVLLEELLKHSATGGGTWIDMAGMLAPQSQADELLASAARGEFHTLTGWETAVRQLEGKTPAAEWDWALTQWAERLGIAVQQISLNDVAQVVADWRDASSQFTKLVLRDAEGEFGEKMAIAFGLDGDAGVKQADFDAVRGSFDAHAFVRQVQQEEEETQQKAERLLSLVQSAC